MMQITFVVAKDNDSASASPLSQFTQCRILPPVGLGRMAGLAGKHGSVKLVDERIDSAHHNYRADIAVFIINSYNRDRCLVLSKLYRDAGSYVVFSGPMLAKDLVEPSKYADSLFIGYGEECMAMFLSDYASGGLVKSLYHGETRMKTGAKIDTAGRFMALSLAS
jgi:hypothetical protein